MVMKQGYKNRHLLKNALARAYLTDMLTAKNMTAKEISALLGVSVSTVYFYLKAIGEAKFIAADYDKPNEKDAHSNSIHTK